MLLEQVRPDVAKLIVLEELEGTAEEGADVLVYGEIAARDFAALLEKHLLASWYPCCDLRVSVAPHSW